MFVNLAVALLYNDWECKQLVEIAFDNIFSFAYNLNNKCLCSKAPMFPFPGQ